MNKQTKRIFFALPIPAEFHNLISQINQLDRKEEKIRWIKPQNYHLILKFIGDFPIENIDAVAKKVAEMDFPKPSKLESEKWAVFPSVRNPRVWVLQFLENNALSQIARKIDQICGNFDVLREERHFKPHLTIGRTKKNSRSLVENFLKTPLSEVCFFPYVIALYESNLTRTGAIYQPLQNFKL